MSSRKLDAAIDALVDVLAELPEHELEGLQRGNRLGLRILMPARPALSRTGAGNRPGSPEVGLSALVPLNAGGIRSEARNDCPHLSPAP